MLFHLKLPQMQWEMEGWDDFNQFTNENFEATPPPLEKKKKNPRRSVPWDRTSDISHSEGDVITPGAHKISKGCLTPSSLSLTPHSQI